MTVVRLYASEDCPQCPEIEAWLQELQEQYPHTLERVDAEPGAGDAPVVQIGPYTLNAPFDRARLQITLAAAQDRLAHIARAEESARDARIRHKNRFTRGNRIGLWFARHYLLVFNVFLALYVGLPFLAPVLMHAGWTRPARWIYRAYGAACHQLAFRSWFLFGEQPAYPRQAAGVEGWKTYEQVINPNSDDLLAARGFIGNENTGFKVAFCERDVAIYAAMLLFGLLFALTGRKLPPLPWYLWVLIGIGPIGLDGFSQLISQIPLDAIHRFLPYRESTPLLRTLTGGLFGLTTAWFIFPMVEQAMRDTRALLESKLARLQEN